MSDDSRRRAATEAEVASVLSGARRLVVAAHVNPDGDAIGSALAALAALRTPDREVRCVQTGPIPSVFSFLPGFGEIHRAPDGLDPAPDVLLALDCASPDRLGPAFEPIRESATVVNIDHHVTNGGFGDLDLVDPASAATGEILHRVLKEMGAAITPEVATCLYAAIVTDTGRFGYAATRPGTHDVAAELLRAGVEPETVHGPLFRSFPESFLRLTAALVQGMKTRLDGRIAWVEMTHTTCADAGMTMEDATDMVDVPASLAGVHVAALFRETARPGETKVSLRSKGPCAVNGIMVAHGGGGHPRAAGCTVHASVEETRDMILAEVEELLNDGE